MKKLSKKEKQIKKVYKINDNEITINFNNKKSKYVFEREVFYGINKKNSKGRTNNSNKGLEKN